MNTDLTYGADPDPQRLRTRPEARDPSAYRLSGTQPQVTQSSVEEASDWLAMKLPAAPWSRDDASTTPLIQSSSPAIATLVNASWHHPIGRQSLTAVTLVAIAASLVWLNRTLRHHAPVETDPTPPD